MVSNAYGMKTASDARQNVRMCQMELDSPREPENESPNPTMPWKQVGIGDANISIPRNMPLETMSTPNEIVTFGQPASTDNGSATKDVEGEMAADGDEQGEDVDSTTSSGDVDPMRVEVAMLAGDSQIACCDQNSCSDLPQSPGPPTNSQKHSCALIRPKRQRGRIKSEARNVRTMRKVENACQAHGNATRSTRHNREGIGTCLVPTCKCWKQGERRRPTRNRCNVNMHVFRRTRGPGGREKVQQALGHVETKGTRCQMNGATSSMRCDSKRVETRLLAGDQAGQHKQQRRKPMDVPGPPASHRKRSEEVGRPKRRLEAINFESRDVSRARKLETAHQGSSNVIRPILRHREGIGTCPDLTIKFRNLTVYFPKPRYHKQHVRDRAAALQRLQALQSTK
ncbi:hypothetical protein EDC04DRAFT_2927767 [Pisolithus marmoratus]|nr:hypothetical protein EDC04DRAFT_2927767 [Pisolithus marmoratus]